MPKRRKGARKKAGRKGWVFGTKVAFFESRKEEWLAAIKRGKPGDFYTKITRMYSIKYAGLEYTDDLSEEVDDPEEDALDFEDEEDLSEEEAQTRAEDFASLRTVRFLFVEWTYLALMTFQKIGQWYRHRYRSLKTGSTAWADIFESVNKAAPPAPRRPRVVQYYSSLFYQDRIKEVFETEWNRVCDLPVAEGSRKPAKINVRNRVTKELWEKEDEETRGTVERAVDAHHLKAMAQYKTLRALPTTRTAEDYHLYVCNQLVDLYTRL